MVEAARLGEAAALSTEADFRNERAARVSLMTMHAAKGLEFPVVFVVGMEADPEVEVLGPIDIAHGHCHQLQLHVHVFTLGARTDSHR